MEKNLLQLSIVIPFFNEDACVCGVCTELNAVLSSGFSKRWELIMVNDGSTDRTGELMNSMMHRYSHFRAIHLHSNSGQSAAMDAGFRAARGEIIGTMDGDGQNDPRDFPILLQAMMHGQMDMVCGIREDRCDSRIRRISSRIANRMRAAVLNDGISDVGCSIRVFRRACLEKIHFFRNAHRFFPALFQMAGCSVIELPVRHRPRMAGGSRYGGGIRSRLFAGLFDLIGVYWMKKRSLRYETTEPENTSPSMISNSISKDRACSA